MVGSRPSDGHGSDGVVLRALAIAAAWCLLTQTHDAWSAEEAFETIAVHLERNLTDNDAEAVFEASTAGAGMTALDIIAPGGRKVISLEAPDAKLGLRHVTCETPEPKNMERLLSEFPAGLYQFTGTTASGHKLHGQAELSHAFPAAASVVHPSGGDKAVPLSGRIIQWAPVKDVRAWIVVIGQESTGREVRANLSGSSTSFVVPEGFMSPGTEYKLELGAVGKNGNTSFIEADITSSRQ
jgi:hypothetical protein